MTKQEELKNKIKELTLELSKEEEFIYNQEIAENTEKLNSLRENKYFILALFEHGRTSCSDENPSNGYYEPQGYARCNKCQLIEILNNDFNNEFEVTFQINISKIRA